MSALKLGKRHINMANIDLVAGWLDMPQYPGVQVKPLVDTLDERAATGSRTRLIRLIPGAATSMALVHPYWEEFFLLSGDIVDLSCGATHKAHAYSCRPPGTPHGPVASVNGCIALEVQYFSA